ncbi:hypothetical protein Taro_010982 [Colocasia esculenta]|uniref:Uncharacterized protein n=1 Tax=Colocasia esculenta TaxID=4460 RepID=A0A843U913_COLES|nr:hypothetical protein [Colocasia esculenta]
MVMLSHYTFTPWFDRAARTGAARSNRTVPGRQRRPGTVGSTTRVDPGVPPRDAAGRHGLVRYTPDRPPTCIKVM